MTYDNTSLLWNFACSFQTYICASKSLAHNNVIHKWIVFGGSCASDSIKNKIDFRVNVSYCLNMLPEYLTNSLHKIAKSEGFIDYKFVTESGSKHGDGFFGVLYAVTVAGTKGQNAANELHLVCKVPPSSKTRCENFKMDIVFSREIYVYAKLLPAFIQFQQEKSLTEINSFRSFPKAYKSENDMEINSHVLIMEDLRPKRYVMWPKENPITFDHEVLVMQELGKFHAISFAMKDQRPNQFHEYTQLNDILIENSIRGKFRTYCNKTVEYAASVMECDENRELLHTFQHTFADMMEDLADLNLASSKEFAIVIHGDCWLNNILFQYDDENVS